MTILGISGGTRNGNNDAICKEALRGAREQGAEISFIRLLDLELRHCTGCGACMRSLNLGQGGGCILKDDFNWLREQILQADGVLFSIPVFEKGAAGVFHTLLDRFGPGHDRGTNQLSRETARKTGGKEPDPRLFQEKPVAFLGTGGTDYTSRFQCDCAMLAMLMMWRVIDCEVFQWTSHFILEDHRIQRVNAVGAALAQAAAGSAAAECLSPSGVCPNCNCSNFYIHQDGTAECCLCGVRGKLELQGGPPRFTFAEEELDRAANLLPGKLLHAKDIKRNQLRRQELKQSDLYQVRMQFYKDFISPLQPEGSAP